MIARILVVDDEPDLEALIQQKFRHQIREGAVSFLFATDGVEALAVLKANRDVDMVAAFTTFAAPTRAREAAPIPVSSDADRPARAGWAALRLLAEVASSF